MADEINSLQDALDKMRQLLNTGVDLEQLKTIVSDVFGKFVDLENIQEGVSEKTAALSKKFKDLTGIDISGYLSQISNGLSILKSKVDDSELSLGGFVAAAILVSPPLVSILGHLDRFGGVGDNFKNMTGQMTDFTGNIGQTAVNMGLLSEETLKTLSSYAKLTDQVNNTENALLSATAAGGNMNAFMKSLDGNFEELDRKTIQFSRMMKDIGNATGLSSSQVSNYALKLLQVPGAMDQVVSAHEGSTEKIHLLEAAIKVARGTFQDYQDVIDDVSDMTLNFGTSGEKALQTISKMYSGAQALGLRMVEMKEFVKGTGDQFKFFGDNTQSAVDIMADFAEPLRNTGLGGRAITQLVQQYTTGIATMGTAQRAFLAQQTGMGGGLRGGLQIEQLLAQGNVNEVSEKLQQALRKQFGGKILTREQALEGGENEARQFEMQRMFLQKGPFGQLASSPEAAAKLLEALSKGQTEEIAKQIGTGSEALEESMGRGDELVERQTTELVEINNQLALVADLQAQTVAALAKETIGTRGPLGERIQDIKEQASARVAEQKIISGVGEEGAPTTGEALSEFGSVITELGSNLVNKFTGTEEPETFDQSAVQVPNEEPEKFNQVVKRDVVKPESSIREEEPVRRTSANVKPEPIIINVMSEGQVLRMIEVKFEENKQQLIATDHGAPR